MTLTYLLLVPLVASLVTLACTTRRLRLLEGVGVVAVVIELALEKSAKLAADPAFVWIRPHPFPRSNPLLSLTLSLPS